MLDSNSLKFRIVLLATSCCILAAVVFIQLRTPSRPVSPHKPVAIPAEGLSFNDWKGKIPGHPEKTAENMKQLYREVQIYRQRHNGQYPNPQQREILLDDMAHHPQEYGFQNPVEAMTAHRNPDMRFADRTFQQSNPEDTDPFIVSGNRQDGALVGSPKRQGTRDVVAWTDIYFHQNLRLYHGDKTTVSPVGFYLVLWDDGQVSKVNWKDVRFVPNGVPFQEFFPGQAGEPASKTLSWDEYEGWKRNKFFSRR